MISTALVLTRQGVPAIERVAFDPADVARGGYAINDVPAQIHVGHDLDQRGAVVGKGLFERRIELTPEQQKLFGIDKLNVPRSDLPAITHVDYSARVQSVDPETNPRYYALIKAFEKLTGYGIIINTSFNVRGEPIVCTPVDALVCMVRADLDALVLGDYLIDRALIPPSWRALLATWETRPRPSCRRAPRPWRRTRSGTGSCPSWG